MNTERTYEQPDAGGTWEHKGLDCPVHGDNVVHAKPYRTDELFRCVRCLTDDGNLHRTEGRCRYCDYETDPKDPYDLLKHGHCQRCWTS